MVPVQAVAKSFFLMALPSEKFPIGSKARETKALMIAERVFRFLVYITTSLAVFWSLKRSNFLHRLLMGSTEHPQFFTEYPCQQLPPFLDDLYVIKLAFYFFEMMVNLLFHR